MTAGSIEGGGTYSPGSKSLTVGGNNRSTEVSGVIADGGFFGGTRGSLVKVGAGTITLSGANSYTGGTTINAGILEAANNQALGNGRVTVNSGGSLQVDSNFQVSIGPLAGSGNINLQPNSALGVNVPTGVSSTFSGTLEGSPAATSPFSLPFFISLGSGTLHLSGTTTLYGVVAAFGGTLEFDSSTALSNNSFLAVSTGATVAVNQVNLITAGITEVQGTGGSIVLNGGSLTIKLPNGVSSVQDMFNGNISGTGSFGINGASITQTLSGNNTYSGATTITAGTLIAGSTTALSPASAFTVNGTLDLGGFSNTIGALNGSGTVTNSANPQQKCDTDGGHTWERGFQPLQRRYSGWPSLDTWPQSSRGSASSSRDQHLHRRHSPQRRHPGSRQRPGIGAWGRYRQRRRSRSRPATD
jgi:fibronectin-binding autotransporter adhesin